MPRQSPEKPEPMIAMRRRTIHDTIHPRRPHRHGAIGQMLDIFGQGGSAPMRSGNLRRGIASVHLLLGLAAEHGVESAACLGGSGIRAERLADPFAEVEAAQELIVVRNIVRRLGRVPGIGLEAGRRYRRTGYGIWGSAPLRSRTLRRAPPVGLPFPRLAFS